MARKRASKSMLSEIGVKDYFLWLFNVFKFLIIGVYKIFKQLTEEAEGETEHKIHNLPKSSKKVSKLTLKERLKNLKLKERGKKTYRLGVRFVDRRPLVSLFTVLGVLFALILIGSLLRKPIPEKVIEKPPKEVHIYSIRETPKITVQAQVEKAGVIKIVALTGGVVSNIFVSEGQKVSQGKTLVALSSNYGGGSLTSLQRQLAALQYQNVKDSEQIQKELIKKQREVAEKTAENAEELRKITDKSLEDTRGLINLNESILSTLNTNLKNLETNPENNEQLILSTKQLISQFQSGVTQLRSSLRSAEFQADSNKPPLQLTNLQKDIALKQFDVQEKALNLSLETSALQLQLAQVQEAAFFPASPFEGVVERIHVVRGQSVSPGTPLITLNGDQTTKIVARVSRDIAQNASNLEFSKLYLNGETLKLIPLHITSDATDGSLYSIIYELPPQYQNVATQDSFIPVEIPIGVIDTTAAIPFVPIDSIYQTQNIAYLFVNENGIAKSREVTLGEVFGQYVEVKSGLKKGEQVILDRTVIEGDKIQIAQ